jgi:hypothetical protein
MSDRGVRRRVPFFLCLAACLWLAADNPGFAQSGEGATYRILILDGQTLEDAQFLKDTLERFDYSPITLDKEQNGYRVLYGYFPNESTASSALEHLDREGITNQGIIRTEGEVQLIKTQNEGSYYVMVRRFLNRSEAKKLEQSLSDQDFATVTTRHVGAYFEVDVGNFSLEDATSVLGKLRRLGYGATSKVTRVVPQRNFSSSDDESIPEVILSPPPISGGVSPMITNSKLWMELSPDQQKDVIQTVMMSQQLRGGNMIAQQVIDIDKRLENLDDKLKNVIGMIEEERQLNEQTREAINDKYKQAEFKIAAKDYQQAIVLLREIQTLDEENRFGQTEYIKRRIDWLQNKISGSNFDGEQEAIQDKRQRLEDEARRLAKTSSGTADPMAAIQILERARAIWDQIKFIDSANYSTMADAEITQLDKRILQLEEDRMFTIKPSEQHTVMIYAAFGAVGLLFILFILVWIRGSSLKKEQVELKNALAEITGSMRPMRELTAGGTPVMLVDTSGTGTGGSTQGESDIFSPQTMTDSLDPLGGLMDDDSSIEGTPTGETTGSMTDASDDDVFGDILGGEDSTPDEPSVKTDEAPATEESGDDLGLDAIFGGDDDSEPGPTPTPAVAEDDSASGDSTGSGLDDSSDVFANLFADDDSTSGLSDDSQTDESSGGVMTGDGSDVETPDGHASMGPISFSEPDDGGSSDDDTGDGTGGEADSSSQNEDLLSLFDSVIGKEDTNSETDGQAGSSTATMNPLDENPFASMLDEEPPDTQTAMMSPPGGGDLEDSEIPSIQLDMGSGADPSAEIALNLNRGGSPETDETDLNSQDQGFDFNEVTSIESPVVEGGVELSFEDSPVGQFPGGWEGDYEYASLTVEGETPPTGANHYLSFQKKVGTGKALYSYRFPEVTGRVEIQFDLRCNDKNKFLLGFYIEKEGDPNQSIHTKILRSEAQTTPTIHMQGESAPYLLGSWANIRYVIDLNDGKVDGYIDNTHVARDLPLQPNPGRLDTLSVRDNINTTGVLLLNNIRVRLLD